MLVIIGQQTMFLFFLMTLCLVVEICKIVIIAMIVHLKFLNSAVMRKRWRALCGFYEISKTWERWWLSLAIETRYHTVKFLKKHIY